MHEGQFNRIKSRALAILTLFLAIMLSSCSSKKLVTEGEFQTVKGSEQIAVTRQLIDGVHIPSSVFEELYPDYSRGLTTSFEIKNPDGSLNEEQTQELVALLEEAKRDGSIQEIIILSWGHRHQGSETPSKRTHRDHHVSAAKNIKKIRKALLKELGMEMVLISAYNMEERPSAIGHLLRTKDARLKTYLSGIDKQKLRSHVIIGVSTTDKIPLSHPALVVL